MYVHYINVTVNFLDTLKKYVITNFVYTMTLLSFLYTLLIKISKEKYSYKLKVSTFNIYEDFMIKEGSSCILTSSDISGKRKRVRLPLKTKQRSWNSGKKKSRVIDFFFSRLRTSSNMCIMLNENKERSS